eukprot:1733242-Rhodomonas_salina.1
MRGALRADRQRFGVMRCALQSHVVHLQSHVTEISERLVEVRFDPAPDPPLAVLLMRKRMGQRETR